MPGKPEYSVKEKKTVDTDGNNPKTSQPMEGTAMEAQGSHRRVRFVPKGMVLTGQCPTADL